MSVVQDIAVGLQEVTKWDEEETVFYDSKGEMLEDMLTSVCTLLGDVAHLTDGKADIEFILGIVGAYNIAVYNNKLDKDAKPPSVLFDEILFPSIEDMKLNTEEVEYGNDNITPSDRGEV